MTDDANSDIVHSARALASAQSQSMAGVIKYIVRPMLAAPTLEEEVQPFFCGMDVDVSSLSAAARVWIVRYTDDPLLGRGLDAYLQLSGRGHDYFGPEALLAATTALTRNESIQREVVAFKQWVIAHRDVTVELARDTLAALTDCACHPGDNFFRMLVISNKDNGPTGRGTTDRLSRMTMLHKYPYVYQLYRTRCLDAQWMSQPALCTMFQMVGAIVADVLE